MAAPITRSIECHALCGITDDWHGMCTRQHVDARRRRRKCQTLVLNRHECQLRFGWMRAAHSPHALDLCCHCAVRSQFHVYDEARDLEAEVIHTLDKFTARHPRPPHEAAERCRLCVRTPTKSKYRCDMLSRSSNPGHIHQVERHEFSKATATLHVPCHLHAKP